MEGQTCPWSNLEPSRMSFCEERLCAWVVEPANTWSNVAYLIVGAYLVWRQRHALESALTSFGVTSILVGIGSIFFHGTGTRIGEIIDVSAMYLISGLFVAFAARRLWSLSDARTVALYVALCVISIAWMIVSRSSGIWLFTAEVTAAGFAELALFRMARGNAPRRQAYREIVWLSLCFVAAFTAWTLDIRKIVCDPTNHVFGGHAFWHCANSFCLYFYYRFHQRLAAS
jgi:hypothetical protein